MTDAHITRQMTAHRGKPTTINTDRGQFAAISAIPADDPTGTVLLVPGYTGSKEDFAALVDPLADAGYRVVAIDQRGQYQSPGSDDPAAYTLDALGADIAAVADTLRGPVHLVGHSFGGLVARAAALRSPGSFGSITLMSSGPAKLPDGPRRAIIEASEPHLHSMGLAAIYDAGQRSLANDPTWAPPDEPLRSFLRERFVIGSPVALQYMGRSMLDESDRVSELKDTGLPAMVIYGRHDNAWPPQEQSDMALRLAAREVIIEGSMHSPAVENPADTSAALIDFWAQAAP